MKKWVLPHKFKYLGAGLVVIGSALMVYYLGFDFRIIMPVFAVYFSFLETKTFSIIQTNVSDELILLLFLTGFLLIIFSREKNERKRYNLLRYKASGYALLLNSALLFLSILFVYGTGFIAILTMNLFSTAIFYLVIFHLLKNKERPK
jgi:amino acid transporter